MHEELVVEAALMDVEFELSHSRETARLTVQLIFDRRVVVFVRAAERDGEKWDAEESRTLMIGIVGAERLEGTQRQVAVPGDEIQLLVAPIARSRVDDRDRESCHQEQPAIWSS